MKVHDLRGNRPCNISLFAGKQTATNKTPRQINRNLILNLIRNLNWSVLGIKDRIQQATGLPVEMDHVANACVLSEVWFER
jgi:hypothetical protein